MALIVSACSSKYRPAYIYYVVEVINNSDQTLSDVKVTLTGFDRTIDCGDITALQVCYEGFGKRRYYYEPIRIEWTDGSGAAQANEYVIEPAATYSTGVPMRAVIDVSENGEMTAYFVQETVF